MIKKCLSVSFIILIPLLGFSQTEVLPVFKNGKWAVMDTTLELISPFQYNELKVLKNNYLLARISEAYGLIDKNLNIIIPFDCQDINITHGNYFIVKKQGLSGLNDSKGAAILECEFDEITIPDSSIAVMQKQNSYCYYRFSDKKQSENFDKIEALGDHILLLEKEGLQYLYDYQNDIKTRDFASIEKKNENLFFSKEYSGKKFVTIYNGGFYSTQTDSLYFYELTPNHLVYKAYDTLYIVDKAAKKSVSVRASQIFKPIAKHRTKSMGNLFSEQFFKFENEGFMGLLNADFKVIINAKYDDISIKGDNFLVRQNEKSGLIDKSGKILIAPKYDYFEQSEIYWLVNDNDKWGIVGNDGKEIITPEYKKVTPIFDNLFIVNKDGKNGVIDDKNRWVLPLEYQMIKALTNRLLLKKGGLCGLANVSGNILLSPVYEDISELNPEYLQFRKNEKSGILNLNGKIIAEARFDEITPCGNNNLFYVQSFSSGQLSAEEIQRRFDRMVNPSARNFKTGIINVHGEILLDTEFYLPIISIDYQTNTIIVEEKSSVLVITFEENGKLIDKTSYKNYVSVKSGQANPEKNIWKQGSKEQYFYYGLFTPGGSRLIDYRFKSIEQQFLNHPDLVKVYSPGGSAGIVNERTGKILLQDVYKVIYTTDLKKSILARCVKSSGRAILIDSAVNIREKGITFIDDFSLRYARVNKGGTLTYKDDFAHKLYLDKEKQIVPKRKKNQEGRDVICEGGKWGVIDSTGEWLIIPQYQFIQSYANGVFIAQKTNKWGVISTDNSILIDFVYDELQYFTDTKYNYWASVPFFKIKQNDKWGVLDKNGTLIIATEYDDIELLTINNKIYFKTVVDKKKILFGLVNETGRLVVEPNYEFVGRFKEGFSCVRLKKRCWKFINLQMKELPEECFFEVHDFSEGLAAVKTNRAWGFLNNEGKMAIPAQFLEVGDFHEGLAKAKIYVPSKLFGLIKSKRFFVFIDKKGTIKFNTKSKYASDVSNGQLVIKKGRKYQVVNIKGKKILPGSYNEIMENIQYGLYAVKNKKKEFALYNSKSELVAPYGKYKTFSEFSEGLCYVSGTNSGFIDTLGKMKIQIECNEAKTFHEGLAAIKLKSGWGFINVEGKMAIPAQYSHAWDFINGTAKVQDKDHNNFYINKKGETVNLTSNASNEQFRIITENGYQGILAADGHIAVYPVAQEIGIFRQGFAPVGIQKQYGLYNANGTKIADPVYMIITMDDNGFIKLINLEEVRFFK